MLFAIVSAGEVLGCSSAGGAPHMEAYEPIEHFTCGALPYGWQCSADRVFKPYAWGGGVICARDVPLCPSWASDCEP